MPEGSSSVPRPRRYPARTGTTHATTPCLADLAKLPPTISVETAARLLGCGRSLAYELVQRGEFPCPVLRLGRRYVVPTAGLLRVLGLAAEAEDSRTAPR
jgi:excisionase family DNA binding protein